MIEAMEFDDIAEKDNVIEIIRHAIEGLSKQATARLIYCTFEKFARDIDEHDAQMSLWYGRKPN